MVGTEEERMEGEEKETIPSVEMGLGASSNDESIAAAAAAAMNEDSDQLKQNRNGSTSSSTKNTNAANSSTGMKAKSCKGCLYYSSHFKADSRNPLCVGLTSSLPNVPRYISGQSATEASKKGKSQTDFRYGCVGYSLYTAGIEQASNGQGTQTELPVCVGLEVLAYPKVNAADSVSAPTHIHNEEDVVDGLPQRRSNKPAQATGDEFLSRFTRNANLVANGVAKNIRRVGNQMKQSLDDILYPYRRRPK